MDPAAAMKTSHLMATRPPGSPGQGPEERAEAARPKLHMRAEAARPRPQKKAEAASPKPKGKAKAARPRPQLKG